MVAMETESSRQILNLAGRSAFFFFFFFNSGVELVLQLNLELVLQLNLLLEMLVLKQRATHVRDLRE